MENKKTKWAKIYANLTKEELILQLKNLVYSQIQFTLSGKDKEISNLFYMIPYNFINTTPKEILENSFSSYTIWQQVEEN